MSDTHTVVLVEGVSDKSAVETLAERHGRNLAAEGVSLVAMGGATNIGTYAGRFGPPGRNLRLAGLYDVGEEADFRRGLERAGLGSDLEALGFFVCVADLEDELIRTLGTDTVERVVDAEGELRSFRTLQRQPAWRGGTTHDQLRRFMGAGSGRKIRYAGLMVAALDLDRVPRPLDRLLAHL
ncbi:TOPRIM nucleotidyl transferase/hydrolase domain-containing protein [Nonomuraea sp. NPDC005650]|uniref:TOPRIM nucleotidyl transferase/hydrolase domain-containing protein n=1 Tax=Nonomuraea sp. NPDC005650 TaxID=3157045 RepID=UPI00339E6DE7